MDASSVARKSIDSINPAQRPAQRLTGAARRWSFVAVLYGLLLVASLLAVRAVADARTVPLDAVIVLAVIIPSAASTSLLRISARPWVTRRYWSDRAIVVLPSIFLLLIAMALSYNAPAWLSLIWGVVFAAEGIAWYGTSTNRTEREPRRSDRTDSPRQPGVPTAPEHHVRLRLPYDVNKSAELEAHMTQSILRSRGDDGAEAIHAQLRAEFAARERTQSLHLAFCPPLNTVPTVQLEQLSGPRASLKVAQIQSFGTRIDLRLLGESDEACSVVVRVTAREAQPLVDCRLQVHY